MIFALSCLLLTTLVGAYLYLAFRRTGKKDGITASQALYNRRMEELNEDIKSGELRQELAEAAEQDIVRVTQDDELQTTKRETRNASVVTSTAIALFIIIGITTATYYNVGDLDRALGRQPDLADPTNLQMIDAIEALKARLAIEPDNVEGWLLLGRTQMEMANFSEATSAFLKANKLRPNTPGIMLQYADSLAMQAGGNLTPQSKRLVTEVLALEPDNISALWLAGLGAAEEKDIELAKKYLNRAREITASVGASTLELDQIIARLSGEDINTTTTTSAETVKQSRNQDKNVFTPSIPVVITISASLAEELDGTEVLFVFARAEGQKGPPVAVRRETNVNFPFRTSLDQSMSMAPQFTLQPGQKIKVAARLSKSGQALPQTGDFTGNAGSSFDYPDGAPTEDSPITILLDGKQP